MLHVHVFFLANRYIANRLQALAFGKIHATLEKLVLQEPANWDVVCAFIRCVYSHDVPLVPAAVDMGNADDPCPPCTTMPLGQGASDDYKRHIRSLASLYAARQGGYLMGSPRFKQLLLDYPELSVDVVDRKFQGELHCNCGWCSGWRRPAQGRQNRCKSPEDRHGKTETRGRGFEGQERASTF